MFSLFNELGVFNIHFKIIGKGLKNSKYSGYRLTDSRISGTLLLYNNKLTNVLSKSSDMNDIQDSASELCAWISSRNRKDLTSILC